MRRGKGRGKRRKQLKNVINNRKHNATRTHCWLIIRAPRVPPRFLFDLVNCCLIDCLSSSFASSSSTCRRLRVNDNEDEDEEDDKEDDEDDEDKDDEDKDEEDKDPDEEDDFDREDDERDGDDGADWGGGSGAGGTEELLLFPCSLCSLWSSWSSTFASPTTVKKSNQWANDDGSQPNRAARSAGVWINLHRRVEWHLRQPAPTVDDDVGPCQFDQVVSQVLSFQYNYNGNETAVRMDICPCICPGTCPKTCLRHVQGQKSKNVRQRAYIAFAPGPVSGRGNPNNAFSSCTARML